MAGERFGVALFAIIVLVLLVSGCTIDESGSRTKFFKTAGFSFSELPVLNKPINLTFIVQSIHYEGTRPKEFENVTILISLPHGFELISGELEWNGIIKSDERMEHTITIKAIKEGRWKITGWAGPSTYPKMDGDMLYIIVSGNSASVSRMPFLCSGTWEEVNQCMRSEATRG